MSFETNGARLRRLLLRTPPGNAPPSPGLARFVLAIGSDDRAAVRRYVHHVAADVRDDCPAINVEAVDAYVVAQTDDELAAAVAEVVAEARAWRVEHRAELERTGACGLMGCRP